MATQTQNPIYPFKIISEPKGYSSKREITNADERLLVKGSKNIIINDGDKWSSRLGYILDGQANTIKKGIDSSFDFISKQGTRILRSNQGATANTGLLQVRTEYVSGTPVITTDDGAFPETNINGLTGYRCNTFADFLKAVEDIEKLDKDKIREYAMNKYTLEQAIPKYDEYFNRILNLYGKGWYK